MRLPPALLITLGLVAILSPARGFGEPLVCFGTEPFWSLDLGTPGRAAFSTPDDAGTDYAGEANTLSYRGETVWRGRAQNGSGDLVAFLREGDCSDNMSDTAHPYAVNVSMPDGRHLAGCCRLPDAAVSMNSIEQQTWRLAALAGEPVPEGVELPLVTFEDVRVQGFAGCNQFSGGYTLEGDALTLGDMAVTMMACMGPGMEMEDRFLAAFSGELAVELEENALLLTPVDGDALRFEAAPAPQLEGVEWEITGYNNGRQAVVSPLLESRITLVFAGGGVSGDAGCNRFSGSFTVTGESLSIGPLATTRRACEGELMAQEQAFLQALQSAATWTVWRGILDMHREDGARALTARSAGQ